MRKTLTVIWAVLSLAIIVATVVTMFSEGTKEMPGWAGGLLFLMYAGIPVIGGGAILVFRYLPEKEREKALSRQGGIRFPRGLGPFPGKACGPVAEALRTAGFTDIRCDNPDGGIIESLTVDGEKGPFGGRMYRPDAPVVMTCRK